MTLWSVAYSVCVSIRDDATVSAVTLAPLRGRASVGTRRALDPTAGLFAVENRWMKLG